MKTGSRLKRVRRMLGLNQVEFAQIVGISSFSIWRWEGHETRFTERVRESLMEVGVNPAYIESEVGGVTVPSCSMDEAISACQKRLALGPVGGGA